MKRTIRHLLAFTALAAIAACAATPPRLVVKDLNDVPGDTPIWMNFVQCWEYILENGGGGSITVDSALSTTSVNPVQNKVITLALQNDISAAAVAATNYVDKATNGALSHVATSYLPLDGSGTMRGTLRFLNDFDKTYIRLYSGGDNLFLDIGGNGSLPTFKHNGDGTGSAIPDEQPPWELVLPPLSGKLVVDSEMANVALAATNYANKVVKMKIVSPTTTTVPAIATIPEGYTAKYNNELIWPGIAGVEAMLPSGWYLTTGGDTYCYWAADGTFSNISSSLLYTFEFFDPYGTSMMTGGPDLEITSERKRFNLVNHAVNKITLTGQAGEIYDLEFAFPAAENGFARHFEVVVENYIGNNAATIHFYNLGTDIALVADSSTSVASLLSVSIGSAAKFEFSETGITTTTYDPQVLPSVFLIQRTVFSQIYFTP